MDDLSIKIEGMINKTIVKLERNDLDAEERSALVKELSELTNILNGLRGAKGERQKRIVDYILDGAKIILPTAAGVGLAVISLNYEMNGGIHSTEVGRTTVRQLLRLK